MQVYCVMSKISYLSLMLFLRALILFQTTTAHVIMHPVAIANTRTTVTAATDPPSPVIWSCCAVVVSVVVDVIIELGDVTGIIVVGGMVVEY